MVDRFENRSPGQVWIYFWNCLIFQTDSKCLINSFLKILHLFKAKYSLLTTKKAILAMDRLCFSRVWKATTNIAWSDRASPHWMNQPNIQCILNESILAACFLQSWVAFWFLFSLITPLSIDDIIICFLLNLAGGLDRISKEPGVQLGFGKI